MKLWYICDEGLPISMDTGTGHDKVGNMQSAIKFLVKNKDTMACKVSEIEVYPLGVTKKDYEKATPLKSSDPIPSGSRNENAIFVHVPRAVQELDPEERRIYASPKKPMARPELEKLVINPQKKKKPKKKPKTEITVRCDNGKEFKAIVNPKHTIADLKKQFGPESGVPAEKQILAKEGYPLVDSKTAEQSGIKNGDVIDLSTKPITVHVRAPNGKTIPVTLKLSDTTEFIKQKVAPESGIEVPRQILKFNGKEVIDGRSAKETGLQDGSYLDLEPRTIIVQVRTPEDKMIPVEILKSDKILSIKEKVEPDSGIAVAKQLMKFNGKELPNEKSAEAMGLQDGSIIDLILPTLQVFVRTPEGNTIPVIMEPSNKIQYIKEKVAPETGIPVSDQTLMFGDTELPSDKTADDMGLQDGSILDLMGPKAPPIQVLVKTHDGKTIPVTIEPSDQIQVIKEAVEPETGIPVADQILKFGDTELPSDETADDMGLQDGSILDLIRPPIEVIVKTPDGKTIPVTIEPHDKIQSIKEAVEPDTGIPVADQILKFGDIELPSDETADDMGLQDGSILDLIQPPIQVLVKTPDGQTIPVTLKPSDKIKFIKESVEPEAGIPVADQILKFNDKELRNSKTAEDAGLKDGSILDLVIPKEESSSSDDDDNSTEFPVHEPKQYGFEFTPTPFDLTRFRAWFMIADTVPFEMICPIAMTIKEFKEEILKLRNDANFVRKYFEGLEDPNELKIFPAGSWGEGEPLPDDIPVPKDSSEYAFFSVFR